MPRKIKEADKERGKVRKSADIPIATAEKLAILATLNRTSSKELIEKLISDYVDQHPVKIDVQTTASKMPANN